MTPKIKEAIGTTKKVVLSVILIILVVALATAGPVGYILDFVIGIILVAFWYDDIKSIAISLERTPIYDWLKKRF